MVEDVIEMAQKVSNKKNLKSPKNKQKDSQKNKPNR